jgi:ribonuclease J
VSGHANQPYLMAMQDLVRPRIVVPMHGEHRHLAAHAALATSRGMAGAIAPNGAMLDLTGDAPRVVEHVDTGRLYLDGTELIGALDGIVRDRIRLAIRGHVAVSVIIDEDGRPLGGVWAQGLGLPDDPNLRDGLEGSLEQAIDAELARARPATIADDDALEELVHRTCARICNDVIGKKPVVSVMISRLEP